MSKIIYLQAFGAAKPVLNLAKTSSEGPASVPVNAEHVSYPGALRSYFSSELQFLKEMRPIPTYRVMDTEGVIALDEHNPKVRKKRKKEEKKKEKEKGKIFPTMLHLWPAQHTMILHLSFFLL